MLRFLASTRSTSLASALRAVSWPCGASRDATTAFDARPSRAVLGVRLLARSVRRRQNSPSGSDHQRLHSHCCSHPHARAQGTPSAAPNPGCSGTCRLRLRLSRSYLFRISLMAERITVTTPCRECRSSPVELIRVIQKGRYLWCPKCHAVWFAVWGKEPARAGTPT
jgi:hypothetical protein